MHALQHYGAYAGSGESSLLSIARSYVGTVESPKGSNRGAVVDTFTGGSGQPWCAYFVSYVVKRAGLGTRTLASVQTIYDRAKSLGVLSSTPSPGAIFLQLKSDTGLDGVDLGFNHTGFVKALRSDGKLDTIEGNVSDSVAERTRSKGEISGYVPYEAIPQVFEGVVQTGVKTWGKMWLWTTVAGAGVLLVLALSGKLKTR